MQQKVAQNVAKATGSTGSRNRQINNAMKAGVGSEEFENSDVSQQAASMGAQFTGGTHDMAKQLATGMRTGLAGLTALYFREEMQNGNLYEEVISLLQQDVSDAAEVISIADFEASQKFLKSAKVAEQ